MPTTLWVLTAMAILAGCNYRSQPIGARTDECGAVKEARRAIVNGVREHDPSVVDLTENQIKSIGALNLDLTGTCTATLVAPDVVLTAAHCVEGISGMPTFLVGESYLPPEASLRGEEVYIHPEYRGSVGGVANPPYDLAVIIVQGDTAALGLEPIPVNFEPTSMLEQTIQAVGYGTTDPAGSDWNTRRWWTTQVVHIEAPAVYTTNDGGLSGLCFGDSGGPMLWTVPGVGPTVMGVASAVDSDDCLGNSLYARTDIAAEWLHGFLDPGPCGDETFEGRCNGNMAVWCEDEEIYYHDCADFGYECAADDAGLFRCRPPCGDETLTGRCDGNVAVWCEDSEIYYHDCRSFGWICGLDSSERSRCIPPDPCRGITFDGICDGNVAVWCEGGELWYHYCDDFSATCGEGPYGLTRCLDECDTLGFEGECDGDTARWCEYGDILERDCAACDTTCEWTGEALGFYCL